MTTNQEKVVQLPNGNWEVNHGGGIASEHKTKEEALESLKITDGQL